MQEKIHKIIFTGAMNSDIESRLIPEGDYLPETKNSDNSDAITGKVGAMANLIGNRLIAYPEPNGDNITIGAYFHDETNKLYRFVLNSLQYHHVIETDAETETTVFLIQNLTQTGGVDVLNFDKEHLILHINVKRGLLFWVDQGYNDARKINISRARDNGYGLITEAIISAQKAQPLNIPTIVYTTVANRKANNLIRKLFNARTQYVYDDFEESAWGGISKRPFNPKEGDPNLNSNAILNNALIITINTGPSNVKKINIAISDDDQFNFYKIATIDKVELGLADNASYEYKFYNDVKGVAVPKEDSLLNYDYFPEKPKCQDLVNDDIIDYVNFEEGTDNVPDLNMSFSLVYETPVADAVNLIDVYKTFKLNSAYIPCIFYIDKNGKQTLAQTKLAYKFDTPGAIDFRERYGVLNYSIFHQPPIDAVKYRMGLTKNLTHQNAVQFVTTRVLPAYDKAKPNGNSEDYILISVKDLFDYKSYKKYDSIYTDFIAGDRISILGSINNSNGITNSAFYDTEILEIIDTETRYYKDYYFLLENGNNDKYVDLTGGGSSSARVNFFKYGFVGSKVSIKGEIYDILENRPDLQYKTIGLDRATGEFDATLDWHIINDKGPYLKIRKPTFSLTDTMLVEVYEPKKAISDTGIDDVFYEVGEVYDILNPGLSNRGHQGQVQDQDGATPAQGKILGADCYLKSRYLKYYYKTPEVAVPGGVSYNVYRGANIIVEDFNFSDYYLSKLYDYGRFSAQNLNAKRSRRIASHRFSRPFIDATNINGLSRFYPGNQKNYEEQYGEVLRIKYENRVLTSLQELKIGKILINQRVLTSPDGSQTVAVSDQLLNDIQYAPQRYGIGKNPESYASHAGLEYFADSYRGVICSMSGLTIKAISEESFYSKYWTGKLAHIRKEKALMVAYIDPQRKKYILTVIEKGSATADTIVLDVNKQRFVYHTDFLPEYGGNFGNKLCTFKNGALWVHDEEVKRNNFYGEQFNSIINTVFNAEPTSNKLLCSVKYQSDRLLSIPEVKLPGDSKHPLGMLSRITGNRFQYINGDYAAPFLRDMLTPDLTRTELEKLFYGRSLMGKVASIQFKHEGNEAFIFMIAEIFYQSNMPKG